MAYSDIFNDPWATIDEQIDRAQAAAGTAWSYTPIGLAQSAYENSPSSETILQTIDDYTYTPWEASNDAAEWAMRQAADLKKAANPLNYVPEIDWKRVAIVAGVVAVSGVGLYWMVKR